MVDIAKATKTLEDYIELAIDSKVAIVLDRSSYHVYDRANIE